MKITRSGAQTHPLGRTLIVTFGRGLAQREGGPIEDEQYNKKR